MLGFKNQQLNIERKDMKKIILMLVAGFVACGLLTQHAQATPISGAITFAGGCSMDTGTVNTATMVTAWLDQMGHMPTVQSRSGDFVPFVAMGATATFTAPWTFNSGPHAAFWTVGGFTFDLTSSHIIFQGGGAINVSIAGTVSGNGFTPTAFTGNFSSQDPPAGSPPVFSFSMSFGSVPDGGATVALLGLALAGIEGIRRKVQRAKS